MPWDMIHDKDIEEELKTYEIPPIVVAQCPCSLPASDSDFPDWSDSDGALGNIANAQALLDKILNIPNAIGQGSPEILSSIGMHDLPDVAQLEQGFANNNLVFSS